MGIEDLFRSFNMSPETKKLVSEIYANGGNANLAFATGYINGLIRVHASSALDARTLKHIIAIAVFASCMAANATALSESKVPAEIIDKFIAEVLHHVRTMQENQKKQNPPGMN